MINKESIRMIRTLLSKHIHSGTYDVAFNSAIEALEKQIPKKPSWTEKFDKYG